MLDRAFQAWSERSAMGPQVSSSSHAAGLCANGAIKNCSPVMGRFPSASRSDGSMPRLCAQPERCPGEKGPTQITHPPAYFWCVNRDLTRKYFFYNHGVRQGGLVRDQEVGGSNPLAPTIPFQASCKINTLPTGLYAKNGGRPQPQTRIECHQHESACPGSPRQATQGIR